MGDFYDQAQAIWSALDAMSEQDPEAYKKFIAEQLQQGKAAFGTAAKASSKNEKKGDGVTCDEGLEEAVRSLSLNSFGMQIAGQGQNRLPSSESYGMRMKSRQGKENGNANKQFSPVKPKLEASQEDEGTPGDNLLDNEIGRKTSMLAQIVKDDKLQTSPEHGDDGEADPIKELVIPSAVSIPSTKREPKKPLIEEL